MMDARQLNLLCLLEPCRVVPFPARRLIGLARECVDVYQHQSNDDAVAKWHDAVDAIEASLLQADIPDEEIDRQVEAFRELVRSETYRRGLSLASSGEAS
jgi:hypothetical protein